MGFLALEKFDKTLQPFRPEYRVLFSSYCNGIAEERPHPESGLLSRPGLDEVPAYRSGWPLTSVKAAAAGWAAFDRGLSELGAPATGFAFDNERPRHRVWLDPFELATRAVTYGDVLDFISDEGYRRPELWLSLGWDSVRQQGWQMPLYWYWRDGCWQTFTLRGLMPIERDVPVPHLSYFEADALARWRGARLPTEAEWEVAAGRTRNGVDGWQTLRLSRWPRKEGAVLECQHQTVASKFKTRWQCGGGPFQPGIQVVAYVGQPRLPGLDFGDRIERAAKIVVATVWLRGWRKAAVEGQRIGSPMLQESQCAGRQANGVGQIGKSRAAPVLDRITKRGLRMLEGQRREPQSTYRDGLKRPFRLKIEQARVFEEVGAPLGVRRAPHRDRFAPAPAQMKQALHVIGMEVRECDCRKLSGRETLMQIGQASVDQHPILVVLHEQATGQPAMTGIAHRTITAQASAAIQWHSAGSAGPQESQPHRELRGLPVITD